MSNSLHVECIVPGCNANQLTKTLFPFPRTDQVLLSKWTEQLPGFDRDINSCFVCENHFSEEEMYWLAGIRCLVPTAVPNIQIDQEESFSFNSCRFCLKDVNHKVPINDLILRSFFYLMNEPLNSDENLPNSCCRACLSDLKYSTFVKKRISETQLKLLNLVDVKDKSLAFSVGFSDPFVPEEVARPDIKLEVEETPEEPEEAMPEDTDDFQNFEEADFDEYKPDLMEQEPAIDEFDSEPLLQAKKTEKKKRVKEPPKEKNIKLFACKICIISFKDRKSLLRHKQQKHPKIEEDDKDAEAEKPKFQCTDCNELISKKEFWRHKETVHNFKRDNSCDVCGLELPDAKQLKEHFKTHSTEENPYSNKNYECFLCGKLLSTLFSLRKHRLTIHPKTSEEMQYVKVMNITKKQGRIPCPECGLMFEKLSLRAHIKRIHQQVRNFECDLCGHMLYSKKSFVNHMETRHIKDREKVQCHLCSKEFVNRASLRGHVKTIHLRIKSEICEHCGLSYPNKQRYKDHVRSKHTGERPYKCTEPDCSGAFTTAVALFKHKANHNKKETKCDICFKVYQSLRSMQDHKRLSHREKKFVCQYENCTRSFAARSQLTTHLHSHMDTRRWQCESCDSVYKQRYHLVRHIRAAHMNFEIKCEVPNCNSKFTRKDFYKSHVMSHHKDLSDDYIEFLLENIRKIKEPQVKPEELHVQRMSDVHPF